MQRFVGHSSIPFPPLFPLPKLEDSAYGKYCFFWIMQIYSIYFKIEKYSKKWCKIYENWHVCFWRFYVRFENLFKYFFSPSRQTARKNLKRNRTLTDSEIILLAQVLGNMTDFLYLRTTFYISPIVHLRKCKWIWYPIFDLISLVVSSKGHEQILGVEEVGRCFCL